MNPRRILLLSPALLLLLAGILALGEALGAWHTGLVPPPRWAIALGAAAAAGSLVAMLHLMRTADLHARRAQRSNDDDGRYEFLQRRNEDLRRQIELLTAMREVTRVVTNDVDFERILEQVLLLVEGLLETRTITIYLADLATGELESQAQRQGGNTLFAKAINAGDLDTAHAQDVFQTQTVSRYAESDELHLLLPLRADRECLGVLELSTALEGSPEAKTAVADQLERQARDIAEHIAVAIKTSHLHDKAIVDGLTKLYTKRHFLEQLAACLNMARRHGQLFSLVLVDIDHFKKVNDTYGHLTGDHVLVGVADTMRKALRKSDAAFRYGGEELAMLLPETGAEGAAKLAERVRQRIEKKRFKSEDGRKVSVTASFGVATHHDDMRMPEDVIEIVDQALYRAKEGGRNQVVVANDAGTGG